MEEVSQSLTAQERALLYALFEDIDTMKVLKKALLQRQMNLAMAGMAQEADWELHLQTKGEIRAAKWPVSFIKHVHKQVQAEREAKQAELKAEKPAE